MAEKNKIQIQIEADIKQLQSSLQNVEKSIKGLEKNTTGSFNGISKAFKGVATVLGGAFAVDKIKDIGIYALQSASDVEEMENKFNVVFKTMGGSIDKWASDFGSAIGRTKTEIKTGVANLGDLLTGYGMTEKSASDLSQKVIELSYDLASFNNVQDADAIDRMTKGILGEHEGLKLLGIALNETNLQAKMQEMGLKGQFAKLDEVTKAQVRWAVMLDQTKNAQGDAVRSADAYANSTKNLKAQIQQVAENFGKELLPLANEVVNALIPVVKDMIPLATEMGKAVADGLRKAIDFFIEFGAKIQEVGQWMSTHKLEVTAIALALGVLATALMISAVRVNAFGIKTQLATIKANLFAKATGLMNKAVKGLKTIGSVVRGAFNPYTLAIMGAIAVGYLIIKNWDKIKAFAIDFANKVKDAVVNGFNWIKDKSIEIWNNVSTFMQGLWNGLCNIVSTAINFIGNIISFGFQLIVSIVSGAIQLITVPFRMIWEVCKSIVMAVWGAIGGFVTGAVQFIANIIKAYITGVLNFWKWVFTTIYNIVVFIFNGIMTVISVVMDIIKGIITVAWTIISTVISTILQIIFAIVSAIWNGIVFVITGVMNIIKGIITVAWNVIVTIISGALNIIKAIITTAWNIIKGIISGILNVIKGIISGIWNSIKGVVTSILNGIKSVISTVWNGIKGIIQSVGNGIKSIVSGIFNGIKGIITGVMNTIKSIVSGAWNTLKSIFNTVLKPNIKLPHIKIQGKFSLNPPEVPKLGIDWYQTGGIFTGASVIGVGENGDEAVLPLSNKRRMKPFATAVASMMGKDFDTKETSAPSGVTINVASLVVREDADVKKIAEELNKLQLRENRKKGLV